MGHTGGLINPRPGRGEYRAGFSNTGGSPKPRKRVPCQKGWLLKPLWCNNRYAVILFSRKKGIFDLYSILYYFDNLFD